ncbi:MAG: HD domain-containing protein [Clostridia bacterium]|nr:HD domain-containing protein [Clostridia bacterium]MBR3552668.1 HD domain-containing protein [Clostridia bacterium]
MEFDSVQVQRAYEIAANAHAGQVDKAGKDYISHPLTVASFVETDDEKTVALLHDVAEDTPVTLQDLRDAGFSEAVVHAVDCVTKRSGEPLRDYLQRVKSDKLATVVKLADLRHNSDLTRIPYPTERDLARVERYQKEIAFLKGEPGSYEEYF